MGRRNPSTASFGFARLLIATHLWGSDVPFSTQVTALKGLLSISHKSIKINLLSDFPPLSMARSHHGLTIAILETPNKEVAMKGKLSRRDFLKLAGAAGLGSAMIPQDLFAQYRYLAPVSVPNPLAAYPNRDWERMYRDIYRHDKTFVFLCCPNDTHNCLLNAFVSMIVAIRYSSTLLPKIQPTDCTDFTDDSRSTA